MKSNREIFTHHHLENVTAQRHIKLNANIHRIQQNNTKRKKKEKKSTKHNPKRSLYANSTYIKLSRPVGIIRNRNIPSQNQNPLVH